jgi:hypothetical protein
LSGCFHFLSAAGRLFIDRTGLLRITETATGTAIPAQHGIDDRRGATDTGLDGDGIEGTIPAAGAAFHAGIAVLNRDVGSVHFEHSVRADFEAHSTAGTFFFIEFQGHDIL